MTPQEKWARLKKPTCLDDYGISMNEVEMRQVPELRHMLAEFKDSKRKQAKITKVMEEAARRMAMALDYTILKAITQPTLNVFYSNQ